MKREGDVLPSQFFIDNNVPATVIKGLKFRKF